MDDNEIRKLITRKVNRRMAEQSIRQIRRLATELLEFHLSNESALADNGVAEILTQVENLTELITLIWEKANLTSL